MSEPDVTTQNAPRLFALVHETMRVRHMSRRTEKAYAGWIHRFIVFHGTRHPAELGAPEVAAFLTHLATRGKVAASTQNQALSALVFLYRHVLEIDLPALKDIVRARRRRRVPTVLTKSEVRVLLEHIPGVPNLMAHMLYGAGLRLLECARLRIQDLDFSARQLLVRDGKGKKDRVTLLPRGTVPWLREHLDVVRRQHGRDLAADAGHVELPDALARKFPHASREWRWQWVFPATRIYTHPETGERRRHHLHETVLQRAVSTAGIQAGLTKRVTCHTLRHHPACRVIPRGRTESPQRLEVVRRLAG